MRGYRLEMIFANSRDGVSRGCGPDLSQRKIRTEICLSARLVPRKPTVGLHYDIVV